MKNSPIVIVCGVPHSYTSMISKFLKDNGAHSQETWDNPKWNLSYSRHEDKELQTFVDKRSKFQKYDLAGYFKSFPVDQVGLSKAPLSTFFLNELPQYTDRKIKVVFVMRNPEQIIQSSLEKSGKSFIFYFERIAWMYRFIQDCILEVLPFMAERIKQDATRLLDFCGLEVDEIDYSSIRSMQHREVSYIKYRFANFIWKKMSRFFRIL